MLAGVVLGLSVLAAVVKAQPPKDITDISFFGTSDVMIYKDLYNEIESVMFALDGSTIGTSSWAVTFDIRREQLDLTSWRQPLDCLTIALTGNGSIPVKERPKVMAVPLDGLAPPTPAHMTLYLLRTFQSWIEFQTIPEGTRTALLSHRLAIIISANPDSHSLRATCAWDAQVTGKPTDPPNGWGWTASDWETVGCKEYNSIPTVYQDFGVSKQNDAVMIRQDLANEAVVGVLTIRAQVNMRSHIMYPNKTATNWWAEATAQRLRRVARAMSGRPYEVRANLNEEANHLCMWLREPRPDALCVEATLEYVPGTHTLIFDATEAAAMTLDLLTNVATGWGDKGKDKLVYNQLLSAKLTDQPVPLGWDLDKDGMPDVLDLDVNKTIFSEGIALSKVGASVALGVVLCVFGTLCHVCAMIVCCVCFCPCCKKLIAENRSIKLPDALGGRTLTLPNVGTAAFDMGVDDGGREDRHQRLEDELHSDGEPDGTSTRPPAV